VTSQTAPVPTKEPERTELPFPPGPIEELLRTFVKAARAHQLYLPNNPIYKGAIDSVRAAFAPVWAQAEDLSLGFSESEILWHGHPVLAEEGKSSDSLPWLFYKDGVREITILKGFEDEELVKLLDILQRIRKASPDEDDLLSLLWEADFLALRYRYVDLALEPAPPLADGAELEPATPEQIHHATSSAVEESRASGLVNIQDFDSTLYFLDEQEISYLQEEVRREYQLDLRTNVLAILLDVFEQQTDAKTRDETLEHLETLMVHMLASGQFRGVAYLLRESQAAAQRARDLSAEHKRRLMDLPARVSAPESLGQLLQSLDEAADLPASEELNELFMQFRPAALSTVFTWLSRLQSPRLRPLLEAAAGRLASASTSELVRLINAPERDVASEAIRRCGPLKAQAAVPALGKVLGSPDALLRQISVQALTDIGSPGALQALERAVEDPDRDVRIATVRALTSRAYRPVLTRLEAIVKGKTIRDADLTEKMAFFEGYGSLCGDAGIEYLDAVLNAKGFLGRREDAELRACAAMALGRIATRKAADALRKASSEKDVVVRNAVNKALRGAST
jgi:hypothetical protein